ncbi:hypothetical protein R4K48_09530 [Brachyspira pulli]|uniref:hypothetical protein n=1 Tax=Brachyspira pulli TaxID=310721 RepID=UPI00300509B5
MKKILILLTILLLAVSCSNVSTNPSGNTGNGTGIGKPEVEIDPNKANIKVSTSTYMHLPIQVIIVGSDNKEIPIGQLTSADEWDNTGYYYKVFTFTPGTYTLIIRPSKNEYFPENKYNNLSFSAGSLEEYEYR